VIRPARRTPPGAQSLAAVLALAVALLAAGPPVAAQGLVGGSGEGPLEINATDGIEWRRDEQVYIARGDATASRAGVTVYGDRLIAHYRETEGNRRQSNDAGDAGDGGGSGSGAGLSTGSTEIYRVEAVGDVRIVDDRSTSRGDKAVYDLDQQVVVMTGDDLRFKTEQETITAEDSLEYWQARDLAVARGDAKAVREDRVIRAEVLAARFVPEENGGDAGANAGDGSAKASESGASERRKEIERIEAFQNVRISTPTEFARGDRGVYNTRTEIATLTGDVRITRGENQLNGRWGQVNLRTGVSRLRGAPPEAGGGSRVRALLQPESAGDVSPSETAQSEARDTADGAAASAGPDDGASEGQTE
jgi:lipopolysaccharide export system protein LptA